MRDMKLGVFDSGLGGVLIARSIREHFESVDMLYLGDTLHIPYGNRSADAIYAYTERSIDYMFKAGCQIIIMACNTASASALRKLQQGYLAENYPDRRVLGVVVPTIEYAIDKGFEHLGVIGTNYTISSDVYAEELKKINPSMRIVQQRTPLLVPLIENGGERWLEDVLDSYIQPLIAQGIEALLLGCTHYASFKDIIRKRYNLEVISQDEIVPYKLDLYFERHPEIYNRLLLSGQNEFLVSDITPSYIENAQRLYGREVNLKHVEL